MKRTQKEIEELVEKTSRVLATLSPQEEKVLRMRFGLGVEKSTRKEIGDEISVSPQQIAEIEATALRKLRHPSRAKMLQESPQEIQTEIFQGLAEKYQKEISPPVEVAEVIEKVDSLSLELILFLKKHKEDIEKIRWHVFEHLVAEFFAAKGFVDVRLVGRDSNTSADIYAVHLIEPLGKKIRFFIEAKREKKKIGINIINSIHGAMRLEKDKFGWHAGIIVSVSRFTNLKKHSRSELELKGIDLKDKDDLFIWLEEYEPNKDGLWLPNPETKMPNTCDLI